MGKKMVSIIVPVYNAALYLERCMASLLGQTYGNTEILLIDDGSTDGSGGICDDFAGRYGKVRVFHTSNAGVSSARNLGLEECGGTYLTFVDADDVLAEDMLEHLVRMIEEENGDVAGCGYFEFRVEERNKEKTADKEYAQPPGTGGLRPGTGGLRPKVEVLCGMEFAEHGILRSDTRCWSKLYRRESVGSLRFDTGLTIGEDMLFLLDLAMQGKQFIRSGYQGYGYYVNENGAMLRGFKDSYMDQITCWQRALEKIEGLERLGKVKAGLTERAEAILVISAMLVVGKLALLSGKERKGKAQFGEQCYAVVKKYGGKRGVFRELDRGYRIKVRVYERAPEVYMVLYRLRTGWKERRSKL